MTGDLEYRAKFIGARTAEDERYALGALHDPRNDGHGARVSGGMLAIRPSAMSDALTLHVMRHDPARALRGVAVNRAILATCTRAAEDDPYGPAGVLALAVLEAMSLEWEHPDKPFTPDWTVSPGDMLADVMEHREWTPAQLAESSGLDHATVQGLLDGTVRVDVAIAEGVARAIGTSAEMWLNAQRLYDAAILRGAKDSCAEDGGNG